MPVKKSTKKVVSKKKRAEFREAADSIPGLIIEHVSFDQNDATNDGNESTNHNKKYMLSDEKRREHQKKKNTMYFGIGVVILVLGALWIMNIKTFFFDAKHNVSVEESLLGTIKSDYNNTVGLLGERPSIVSSTVQPFQEETLKAALIAGLASVSTTSSTASSTVTSTSTPATTSTTPDDTHFPTAKTVTSSTSTKSTP